MQFLNVSYPIVASGSVSVSSSWQKFRQMIMRRNFHFRARAQLEGKSAALAGAREVSWWEEATNFNPGEVPFSNVKAPTPEIRGTCEHFLSDV
jgi:hypothetical protein